MIFQKEACNFNFKFLLSSTYARIELFNGKGALVEGCIEKTDRTGIDFVATQDPKVVLPQSTQWHVFVAIGKVLFFPPLPLSSCFSLF